MSQSMAGLSGRDGSGMEVTKPPTPLGGDANRHRSPRLNGTMLSNQTCISITRMPFRRAANAWPASWIAVAGTTIIRHIRMGSGCELGKAPAAVRSAAIPTNHANARMTLLNTRPSTQRGNPSDQRRDGTETPASRSSSIMILSGPTPAHRQPNARYTIVRPSRSPAPTRLPWGSVRGSDPAPAAHRTPQRMRHPSRQRASRDPDVPATRWPPAPPCRPAR